MPVVAMGTGKALKLGENGDVDVVLVHARQAEDEATSEAHREKSRGFLKGLNTFLRQFYERQDLARPEMLKIHVPEGSTAASPLVDLLWE